MRRRPGSKPSSPGDGRDDIDLVNNCKGDGRLGGRRSVGRSFAFVGIQTLETFDDSQRWIAGFFIGHAREELVRASGRRYY